MVPIAIAVVPVENRENWRWFLGELLEEIGGLGTEKLSFISDRQKGLIEALKELVPESEHRYCIRHMYQNFKLKFKSQELKTFFWRAASTGNKRDFQHWMKKIEDADPKRPPTHDEMTTTSQEVPPLSQEDGTSRLSRKKKCSPLGEEAKSWSVINTCIKYTPPTAPEDVPHIAVTNTRKWTKKPTISEVLENIRKNFKSRKWKS
ncbi:UNVERIFIED_CONTAM: hypothetical protein Sradi_0751100 [Sesamum radiatum]|uniref:MULE transposase domain-containing protein n=1 Tax=Sesamum radiatum TaxID=300843 RepID=A0AAW2VSE4_SESRA